MAKEIERKFLVKGDSWRQQAEGKHISQAYLARGKDCVFRVRAYDDRAVLTIKGRRQGISGDEFEYEIPLPDARIMIKNYSEYNVVEKIRYLLKHDGHIWEIDEFLGENQGLTVAEIELSSESEKFTLPVWAGEEVSLDERYTNLNLAKTPYKQWENK